MFNREYIHTVAELLTKNKHTIAVAESVTGGLLQGAISSADYAAEFYEGGITCYNVKQKFTHLHVNLAKAVACNCVSEQTASEMALAAAKNFTSHFGIGITGYASVAPGRPEVYALYAIACEGKIIGTGLINGVVNEPFEVQVFFTNAVLSELIKHLRIQYEKF